MLLPRANVPPLAAALQVAQIWIGHDDRGIDPPRFDGKIGLRPWPVVDHPGGRLCAERVAPAGANLP